MSGSVDDWHPGFLAQIYEQITGTEVEVEDDSSKQVPPPKVTRVDSTAESIVVEFIAVNPDTMSVENYEKRIDRDDVVRATENNPRTDL